MTILLPLLRKEWMECIRTYKLLLFIITAAIIGIMSPFIAIITPHIIEQNMPVEMKGINIPEATAFESYQQFFKNMNQIGFVILSILLSGILSNELTKGTLLNLLTKGLRRKYVILSKWLISIFMWTTAYIIGTCIHYGYTQFYFEDSNRHILSAYTMPWIFGLFLISFIIWASVVTKNSIGVLISVITMIVCLFLLNFIKDISTYNPLYLISTTMEVVEGKSAYQHILTSMCTTVLLSIICLVSSIHLFNKTKI